VDVAAIIVIGAPPARSAHGANGHSSNGHGSNGHGSNGHGSNGHSSNTHAADGYSIPTSPEEFVGLPIALMDVLGASVVQRVVDRLRGAGISAISVLFEERLQGSPVVREAEAPDAKWAAAADPWAAAEDVFTDYAAEGADNVIVIRLGAYAEFDPADLLQFHVSQRQHVTQVFNDRQTVEAVVINSDRRNDAACLFRSRLTKFRSPAAAYLMQGYMNPLETPQDLRRLAQDGLLKRCALQPAGKEIRPGIWLGEHAHVHRRARLIAPCYVGPGAKIRAAAVLTRATAVEHHAEVDCGTVVEDASIMPYTYLGSGLDFCHMVVGFRQIVHLHRHAQVEISDPRLVDALTASAPWRTIESAAVLATYLPLQFLRGLLSSAPRQQPSNQTVRVLSPALDSSALQATTQCAGGEDFSANLAAVRRYGDQ